LLCAVAPLAAQEISKEIKTAVEAADRIDTDKNLDGVRYPAKTLAFFGVKPGMKVADLGAGQGYTSELVARVVGKDGKVHLHNPPQWGRFVDKPLEQRLTKPEMANVANYKRPFDDPLPGDVKNLDLVLAVLCYHDTVNMPVDRDKMNKAVFAALKPGGVYGVIDHHAPANSGLTATNTIHRIDAEVVRKEVEAAGFELVEEADFLRYLDDSRDFMAWGRPVQPRTDRFVYKFRKPVN